MSERPHKSKAPLVGIRRVIAANVQALLDVHFKGDHRGQIGRFRAKHSKIALSKMQRAVNEGAVNLDTIEELATAFKISPYQLLIEKLNAKDPQVAIPRSYVATARRMAKELAETPE